MNKIKSLALVFGALAMSLVLHAVELENVSNGEVRLGEWNSNFKACKSYAESKGIPMFVFWSNPGCAKCNKMKTACNTSTFVSWRESKGIVMVFSEGDGTVKAFVRNASGHFPYMRFYWPAGGVDVKFSGRSGEIGAGGSTLEGQLINRLNSLLGSWGGSEGYVPPRNSNNNTPVIGTEWNRARKFTSSYWLGEDVYGRLIFSCGKVNKKKGTAKIKVQFVNIDGKTKTLGSKEVKIDSTTSSSISSTLGTIRFNIKGNAASGTFDYDNVSYTIRQKVTGGIPANGSYVFSLDLSQKSLTQCQGLNVINGRTYLPLAQKFTFKNAKMTFPAKGSVRYDKANSKFTINKMDNPSALKLTYNKTQGYFKGTFTVYCQKGTMVKKYTAVVGGYMVGNQGSGQATIKNVGVYPVDIVINQ